MAIIWAAEQHPEVYAKYRKALKAFSAKLTRSIAL